MEVIRELPALRAAIAALRAGHSGRGARDIALVPTMGALHAGHIALVDAARGSGAAVVASIFVNPRQFGAGEDLSRYPRRETADLAMLSDAGCDIAWLPTAETMYPAGFATNIGVSGVSDGLDGTARPGHFDGVATVVTKLLNQVAPTRAYFGEKDYQQLAVVRRLVTDLDLPVEIVGVPTERADDGLALSSRNIYLDDADRAKATVLPRALGVAQRAIEEGGDGDAATAEATRTLEAAGFEVDYVALVDADTLAPGADPTRARRLLAAARLGATRLIDNLAVAPMLNERR